MTKGSKKYRRKGKGKGKENNHTHKNMNHKHKGKGNKKHNHKLDNANYDVNIVVGDNNSVDNKDIASKIGGMFPIRPQTPPPQRTLEKTMSLDPNKIIVLGNKNFVNSFVGHNNIVNSDIRNTKKDTGQEEMYTGEEKMYTEQEKQNLFPPIPLKPKEEEEKEDHEIDEILEYIDINYILNEENEENIMDYISYCVYQWELYEQLYKDYSIPKDEYYQNMIDELYNDSLYTNNIDKDYDFISDTDYDFISFKNQSQSDETQSGGGKKPDKKRNGPDKEGIIGKKRKNEENEEKEGTTEVKEDTTMEVPVVNDTTMEVSDYKTSAEEDTTTTMEVAVDNNEIEKEKEEDTEMEEDKEEKTPDEKINIIKDIFSKNDSYHDFLKGTRAVYLQPPLTPLNEYIINKMGSLLAPQEQTSQSSTYPIQTEYSDQPNVLEQYSQILQGNLHSEGSVLKKTLALDGIDTKKTFSSYIKDDELGSFIDKINEEINEKKKQSIITNYFIIPKISQNENSDFSLEDNYMYFIRKDANPKNNYNMLQHICKDMGLTYTVCLGVFLNELVKDSSTVVPIPVLDSLDVFKSYSKQFLEKIGQNLKFKFLEEIKTLAKKMDPIVRSLEQVVDFTLNENDLTDKYKTAYQLVLKYLFGIEDEINNVDWIRGDDNKIVGVEFKFNLEPNKNILFYFTTNTVEIVSQAIVAHSEAIVAQSEAKVAQSETLVAQSETISQNVKVNQILNTAQQIHHLQSSANQDDIIIILTKLKTQGDLYQIITAYLINLDYPISFYTEDRLCLSIAFMINNFLKEEGDSKPLNVFFKASSGQYEDETSEDNIYILMDTKMNKEVTVCSSAMLLTTKNDYILMCKNEISKVEQDFIKFRDRFADKPDEYGINKMYEYARKQLNT